MISKGRRWTSSHGPATSRRVAARLADAIVCLINAHGGHVAVGVEDKATDRDSALTGVPASVDAEALRRAIYERTRPSVTPFVTERQVNGVRILVLTVPPGVQPHSNAAGLATRRQGSDCLPYPPSEQREWLTARGHIDWSAAPSSAVIDDLDEAAVSRVRALLTAAGRGHTAELDAPRMLTDLRLMTDDGRVTNAGVLLMAREHVLRSIVPSHGYSYQYRPTPGSEATSRFRETGPLLAGVEAIVEAIDRLRQVHPLNVAGGVQMQLSDYPARPSGNSSSTDSCIDRTRPTEPSTSSTAQNVSWCRARGVSSPA